MININLKLDNNYNLREVKITTSIMKYKQNNSSNYIKYRGTFPIQIFKEFYGTYNRGTYCYIYKDENDKLRLSPVEVPSSIAFNIIQQGLKTAPNYKMTFNKKINELVPDFTSKTKLIFNVTTHGIFIEFE